MQLPFEPPWPPGFFPPPSGLLDFVLLHLLFVEIMLLALPRKMGQVGFGDAVLSSPSIAFLLSHSSNPRLAPAMKALNTCWSVYVAISDSRFYFLTVGGAGKGDTPEVFLRFQREYPNLSVLRRPNLSDPRHAEMGSLPVTLQLNRFTGRSQVSDPVQSRPVPTNINRIRSLNERMAVAIPPSNCDLSPLESPDLPTVESPELGGRAFEGNTYQRVAVDVRPHIGDATFLLSPPLLVGNENRVAQGHWSVQRQQPAAGIYQQGRGFLAETDSVFGPAKDQYRHMERHAFAGARLRHCLTGCLTLPPPEL